MNLIQAVLLGMVQGLTEFLPVSSSGHLALLQNYFGEVSIGFDVAVHAATLLAVVAFFYKDISRILMDFFTFKTKSENFKLAIFLFLASIPAAVFGYFFSGYIESYFSNLLIVGFGFFISGLFLFTASFSVGKSKLNYKNTFFIGLSQALAIIPGISRSGATISTGILSGIERRKAVKFSFLLSIPIIIGVVFFKLNEISFINSANLIAGFLSAFIFGFFAVLIFFKYVKIENFRYFACYCWLLAFFIFISQVL